MKKIIRLNETDLTKIIKRIINEQEQTPESIIKELKKLTFKFKVIPDKNLTDKTAEFLWISPKNIPYKLKFFYEETKPYILINIVTLTSDKKICEKIGETENYIKSKTIRSRFVKGPDSCKLDAHLPIDKLNQLPEIINYIIDFMVK